MGDKLHNMEIFKKLNIDASNQWIFYDERFHSFFEFLTNTITDDNLLTNNEVLQYEELLRRNEIFDMNKTETILKDLEIAYPKLLTINLPEIRKLQKIIAVENEMIKDFDELIMEMKDTQAEIDDHIYKLEHTCKRLEAQNVRTYTVCFEKSVILETLQEENNSKCIEIDEMFSKIQLPELFMHKMALDQYFAKCDSFMQYFSLYLKKHFKIFNSTAVDNNLMDNLQDKMQYLEHLEKLFTHYQVSWIAELAEARGIQNMIDGLDLDKMLQAVITTDLGHAINEMSITNNYQAILHNTLKMDLRKLVEKNSEQTIGLVLLKNTKCKLERAIERNEQVTLLSDIVFKALSNAELIWIAIQIDMERLNNHYDNIRQLKAHNSKVAKRTQLMPIKMSTKMPVFNYVFHDFVTLFSQLLCEHLGQEVHPDKCDRKTCIREYEKCKRLLHYAEQNMIQRKYCINAYEQLKQIDLLESTLGVIVYDGPIRTPAIENVHQLEQIFDANIQHEQFSKQFRYLRKQFSENISERMRNDSLWRYQQMLWIWFLTEPHKILDAMEEVKTAATKIPQKILSWHNT